MTKPRRWHEFCIWLQSNEVQLPPHINAGEMSRFAARYHLATGFQGLHVDGFSKKTKTIDGYSAIFKVFLAYSALEQLHKASQVNPKKPHIHERWGESNPELGAELRQAPRMLEFLQEHMHSPLLKNNLKDFIDGKNNICLYVTTGIRNAVAHGFISVHANDNPPQKTINFCSLLSQMLLDLADKKFVQIIEFISH